MMAEIDILKAQIVRQDVRQPWGFQLQGGADVEQPLSINRVTPGSPAAKIGLRSGDQITEIYGTTTSHLTQQQALNFLDQHGLSLIITIERNARGSVPVNPVLQYQSNYEPPKNYQPLDMSGGSRPRQRPVTIDYDLNNYVAQSKLFEAPPGRPQRYEQPYSNQQVYQQQQSDRAEQLDRYHTQYLSSGVVPTPQSQNYSLDDDFPSRGGHPQSRTFRMLQSVMQNEEPALGEAGLPPPRSAFMEQQQREQVDTRRPQGGGAGGGAGGGRMKVFMPQQYNSPMGIYSADNLLETFAVQAESMLDTLESRVQHGEEPHPVYGSNGLLQ